jgi:calcineurin-like phosphoesterase family protein
MYRKNIKMKLTLNKENNIWITSDTHYGHTNICRGVSAWKDSDSTRDFPNLDSMNSKIVDNINNVVMPNDTLIHVGDWSFGGIGNISEFRKRIMCKNIILVLGNHDHHIKKNTNNLQELFSSVHKMLELELRVDYGKNTAMDRYSFAICHYPIASWEEMNRGVIHLHGHVHLPYEKRLHAGKAMDIGVDGNNLCPHNIKDIISIMCTQPIAKLHLPNDHHEKEMR